MTLSPLFVISVSAKYWRCETHFCKLASSFSTQRPNWCQNILMIVWKLCSLISWEKNRLMQNLDKKHYACWQITLISPSLFPSFLPFFPLFPFFFLFLSLSSSSCWVTCINLGLFHLFRLAQGNLDVWASTQTQKAFFLNRREADGSSPCRRFCVLTFHLSAVIRRVTPLHLQLPAECLGNRLFQWINHQQVTASL